MMRSWIVTTIVCGMLLVHATTACCEGDKQSNKSPESQLALNDPETFAWQVFAEVNDPADPKNADGPVAWEKWALARRVYESADKKPIWSEVSSDRRAGELENLLQQKALQNQEQKAKGEHPAAFFDPEIATGNEGDEVRMNRAAFDYVTDHNLFCVEGQEAMFGKREKIDFPTDAREVKAIWRKLESKDDPKHYHTTSIPNKDSTGTEVWGLVSLHLTTKDLPNWFWATWEHEDNPERESVVKSVSQGKKPGNLKEKWTHYVLRGTQVDFTDSMGRPTILANSRIEDGFQQTSSCITCHARATIGAHLRKSIEINRLPIFESATPPRGAIGAPDAKLFGDGSTTPDSVSYWQTDFSWSTFRAKRKTSPNP